LTFLVAGSRRALPAADIAEIIRPRIVTRVPRAPPSLLGVANLRGAVLPVVSLAALLGGAASTGSDAARIVVVDKASRLGLWVDEIEGLSEAADCPEVPLDDLLARAFGAALRSPVARHDAVGQAFAARAAPVSRGRETALITLRIGAQDYALPLDDVAAIVVLPRDVIALPGTDAAMIGVAQVRDATLPLVSLRALLGLKRDEFDRLHARIVVTWIGGALAGLVVDRVGSILRVPEAAIDSLPVVLTRGKGEARIEAVCRLDDGNRLVLLLSAAGLFDRETAARVRVHAAGGAGAGAHGKPSGVAQAGVVHHFVVFRLGDEQYGLPIAAVDEVVRRPAKLARVPQAPAFLDGIMNLRGQAIPVIDQRRRFATDDSVPARHVIVVSVDGLRAGFCVDSVSNTLRVSETELRPVPALSSHDTALFDRIAGIERDGHMILLIDPATLMNDAARDLLTALAGRTAEALRA
jgi:purine-binding chemotaxis protein CheW